MDNSNIFIVNNRNKNKIVALYEDGYDINQIVLETMKPFTLVEKCLIGGNYSTTQPNIVKFKNSEEELDIVLHRVCEEYKIKKSDLVKKCRNKEIILPRQMTHFLCYELTRCSFKFIGDYIGGLKRCSIYNSIRKTYNLIETDRLALQIYVNIYEKCLNDLSLIGENEDTSTTISQLDLKDIMLNPSYSSILIETAMKYGVKCHKNTNHKYDDQPYHVHLKMAYDYGCKYADLLPLNKVDIALAGCWVHDTIEDTRQTYNDVKEECGEDVAEIAFALTNEKGKTRKDRACNKYYYGIKVNPVATFVKLCDRLANTKYSKEIGSRMLAVYRKEYDEFKSKLWNADFKPMFDELEELNNIIKQ
jgi:hypothetical protein